MDTADPARLTHDLAELQLFSGLKPDQLETIAAMAEVQCCARGEALVTEGDIGSDLYVVLSGRFVVRNTGSEGLVGEIGPGQPIGEIGFIAGLARTATVIAERESIVLVLAKNRFDAICQDNPSIWMAISQALARRLADANANVGAGNPRPPSHKTIALIPAGPPADLPQPFVESLLAQLTATARVRLIGPSLLTDETRGRPGPNGAFHDYSDLVRKLNEIERDNDHVVYVADKSLTDVSKLAIRQADIVLAVGRHDPAMAAPVPTNPLEDFAARLHRPANLRLVLIHRDPGDITGTRHWLANRAIALHHHVLDGDDGTHARLARYIRGTALGFVAGGGGALCCAHLGAYKALTEAGHTFDAFGGTSGGSAMAAALAHGVSPEDVERQTHDAFVTGKALARLSLPLYSLLDHRHFDAHLQRLYGSRDIEDCWVPWYAVATDLSNGGAMTLRRGSLWQAIRASSALPALLPPFFTAGGEMLVDGGLVDNLPIRQMHDLKSGPNIAIGFDAAERELFDVDYDAIPSRLAVAATPFRPRLRARLQQVPKIPEALTRSLLAGRRNYRLDLGPDDLVLQPPLPDGVGIMDWHESRRLMDTAHAWVEAELARLRENADGEVAAPTP